MTETRNRTPAIEFKQVSFGYGNKPILEQSDITINQGDIVGIVGLSGSGKTTMIRLINGAMIREGHHDYTGEILVQGNEIKSVKHLNRLIGTIYQDTDNQLIFTTVIDEIVFGMENYQLAKEEMNRRLTEVTASLGIKHLLNENPNNLSGGEKQLVVLASILCLEVKILILDESMAGVDRLTRQVIVKMIDGLKKNDVTVIMIEHDYDNLEGADVVYKIEDKKIRSISMEKPTIVW